MGTSPPHARLVLNIGVTGHRTRALAEADEKVLYKRAYEVLEEIKSTVEEVFDRSDLLFRADRPILRVISPLAEGADRIIAKAAIELGFELQCPLPFNCDEYEKDFTSDKSRSDYRELIDKATAVFELDGTRDEQDDAYLAVGQIVLNQSDIMIAIWDGKAAKGKGGTAQIIKVAKSQNIPVIWIQSQEPHYIYLTGFEDKRETWHYWLKEQVLRLLTPKILDSDANNNRNSNLLEAYFSEKQYRWAVGFYFKLFRDVIAHGRLRRPRLRVGDFEEETKKEWQKGWQVSPKLPQSLISHIDTSFCNNYAWADKLADHHANLYRSSFVLNYFMGGLAVFLALVGYALGITNESSPLLQYEWIPIAAELFIIVFIIGATLYGNHRRWHERWIDYRLLAERLRTMRFLAPLGLVAPSVRVPAHHSHGDMQDSWIDWYSRAIIREAGLANIRMDADYLGEFRTFLMKQELRDQIEYHTRNMHQCHKITHRLHMIGLLLFAATLVACISHLLYHGDYSSWLTLLSAVLPAFGAAYAGILFQGEFERLSRRSAAMSDKLQVLYDRLKEMKTLSSKELGQIAEEVADTMVAEVLDWRIVLQARPLTLPS